MLGIAPIATNPIGNEGSDFSARAMLGIRNPKDGPVFEKLDDAIHLCISGIASHFKRGLRCLMLALNRLRSGAVLCHHLIHPQEGNRCFQRSLCGIST